MLNIQVPATSANLGPGFDSLGLALKIYNNFIFEKIDTGVKIEIKSDNGQKIDIPFEKNLIFKTLKKFEKESKIKVNKIKIVEKSKIAIARGLGSSATAIVATLYGLNKIYNNPFKKDKLIKMACEIEGHGDNVVPAFIGGFTISVLENNQLIYEKISVKDEKLKVILIIPDFKLKTSDLRKVLPKKINHQDAVYNSGRTALLTSIFANNKWDKLSVAMKDKLHQDYRAKLIPGFKSIINTGYEAGVLGMALSGAGPTIIAFTRKNPEKIAKKLVKTFSDFGITSDYIVTSIDNRGIMSN